ncbi:Uncharacterised protein [Edwardsiella hoshinae]|uniref:Uncharacterized protein n=1 Tax=Edwardsiella hoshinae TaxID=93378 RepID=A0A376DNC7_9GAMM|nr:tetratricopeptide repeat protein [Edwardsiella hoshinae]STC91873.1 Uncharacterised protein [Edwardsiella hoshinae]
MDLIVAIDNWPLRQAVCAIYQRHYTIMPLADFSQLPAWGDAASAPPGMLLMTDRRREGLLHAMDDIRRHSALPVIIINRRESYLTQLVSRFFPGTYAFSYDSFYRHTQRRNFHPLDLCFLPYSRGVPVYSGERGSLRERLNAFGFMTLYQRGVTLREASVLISLYYRNNIATTARLLGMHEQAVVYCKRALSKKLGLDPNRTDLIRDIFLLPSDSRGDAREGAWGEGEGSESRFSGSRWEG